MRGTSLSITPSEIHEIIAAGKPIKQLAYELGCNVETIRRHLRSEYTPTPDRKFAERIGSRSFEDVHLKPAGHYSPISAPRRHDRSLTGCGSALACV